jgi:hypothetical protein
MYKENYGEYAVLTEGKDLFMNTWEINPDTWHVHFKHVLNLIKDAIETNVMNERFVHLDFGPDPEDGSQRRIRFTIPDYWINLIFWNLPIGCGETLQPRHIFFMNGITRSDIKEYIDLNFVEKYRTRMNNTVMNNKIDDCVKLFINIDQFALFLSNTLNLEDFIELMENSKDAYDIMHCDLSDINLEDTQGVGMALTHKLISIICNSDHCLAPYFISKEGVNIKQFKEFAVHIGTKPDGRGSVYPIPVNKSYLTGGSKDLSSFRIESSVGRTAQIILEKNVGDSGYFGRMLGLNNSSGPGLHEDPHFICKSKNFQPILLTKERFRSVANNRYYRKTPDGMEYKLTKYDEHLIGTVIYLRSPMTCASASSGEGICYRCYGDLAYTNADINLGKMAAEEISREFTQKMLSAKHLLEASVKELNWTDNRFLDYFSVNYTFLKVNEDALDEGFHIIIDLNDVDLASEDDEFLDADYNKYISKFVIKTPSGELITVETTDSDDIVLMPELDEYIGKISKKFDDDVMTMDIRDVINSYGADARKDDINLFGIKIYNNDLSKSLEKVKGVINKKRVGTYTKEDMLSDLVDATLDAGLRISSVHLEVILMNQLRHSEAVEAMPEWEYPNEPYQILTLTSALQKHPSVTVTLSFEQIKRALFNPTTFKKTKPSQMDLFFMSEVPPQVYLSKEYLSKEDDADENGMRDIIRKLPEEEKK